MIPRPLIVPAVFEDHVVQLIVDADADVVPAANSRPTPRMAIDMRWKSVLLSILFLLFSAFRLDPEFPF